MTGFFIGALWGCLLLAGYHFVVYPALLLLVRPWLARPVLRGQALPRASVVIAAFNEASVIAEKIEATLSLDYPDLEIIVVSDGSDDATEAIASSYEPRGVWTVSMPERQGKARALARGVELTCGEILVISDANAFPEPSALRHLIAPFSDPSVGCVSGRVRPHVSGKRSAVAASEAVYWRYEDAIKEAESAIWSATGVVGSLMAVRRSLYEPVPTGIINDDAYLMMSVMRSGKRVIYEPGARCSRHASRQSADEIGRRKRIAAGRWQLMLDPRLWPWNAPVTVLMLTSHKLLRLLLPFLMVGLTMSTVLALLSGGRFWWLWAIFGVQAFLIALAMLGWRLESRGLKWRPASLALYAIGGNLGMALGLQRYLNGGQSVLWQKAER
jgi:biofilm PGA synthesis N-glycosyltransferase PgaC